MQRKFTVIICFFTFLTCLILNTTISASEYNMKVIVESKQVVAGEEFSVNISLKDNPGIIGLRLCIKYDSQYLTLVGAEDKGLLGNHQFTDTYANPYFLLWNNGEASDNFMGDGVVATLKFRAKEDVMSKSTTDISVSIISPYDILSRNLLDDSIELIPTDGKITISSSSIKLGDVNSDGKVDIVDLVKLYKYLQSNANDNVSLVQGDLDGNNTINSVDLVLLRKLLLQAND